MAYNDWRDLTHQNAYAPQPQKIEVFQNLYGGMMAVVNRPYTSNYALKMKECDNVAFIMDWLDDVLIYFDYPYITPILLHQLLFDLDREVFNDTIDAMEDFTLRAGDVIILSTEADYTDTSAAIFYIGVYIDDTKFLSFDNDDGLHYAPMQETLEKYTDLQHVSVMRI